VGRDPVSCEGTFAVGAVAEAPPATAKVTPATPNTGKLVFARFRLEGCFACAMVEPSLDALPQAIPSRSIMALCVNRKAAGAPGACVRPSHHPPKPPVLGRTDLERSESCALFI
jgi:hypothetical protein